MAQVVSKVVLPIQIIRRRANWKRTRLNSWDTVPSQDRRNAYLTGAQELRNGVKRMPTPNTASPDAVRAMSTEMILTTSAFTLTASELRMPEGFLTLIWVARAAGTSWSWRMAC